ncbi:MAG TPA: zf-HC2 domain-containing protein [Nitrospiraceae bacterium]|jgi:anti-sigma factor RsiW
MKTTRRTPRTPRRRSTVHCRKILRTISEYLDNDLPKSACAVIRKHLGACAKCERVVRSLKRTINLCRKADVARLTASDKTRLRKEILSAVSRL